MANTLGLDPGIVGSSPTSSAIILLRVRAVAETRKRKHCIEATYSANNKDFM